MSDVNHITKIQSSGLGVVPGAVRKPRRPAVAHPGSETSSSALLNQLHQELEGINEGIVRTNTALSELVAEVKSLRVSAPEEPSA